MNTSRAKEKLKKKLKINLFVSRQMCACEGKEDCCAAPGQSPKEISELAESLEKATRMQTEINQIMDINVMDKFPKAVSLFKQYGYNCLPIVMVGSKVASYGIPDQEFIIDSIRKVNR